MKINCLKCNRLITPLKIFNERFCNSYCKGTFTLNNKNEECTHNGKVSAFTNMGGKVNFHCMQCGAYLDIHLDKKIFSIDEIKTKYKFTDIIDFDQQVK